MELLDRVRENVSAKIKGAFNLRPVRRFYLSLPNHLPRMNQEYLQKGSRRIRIYLFILFFLKSIRCNSCWKKLMQNIIVIIIIIKRSNEEEEEKCMKKI